jgi:hypothetical protein
MDNHSPNATERYKMDKVVELIMEDLENSENQKVAKVAIANLKVFNEDEIDSILMFYEAKENETIIREALIRMREQMEAKK